MHTQAHRTPRARATGRMGREAEGRRALRNTPWCELLDTEEGWRLDPLGELQPVGL